MKACALFVFCLLVANSLAVNPGSIFGLRAPILNQIKDQYYDLLALGFQYIFLPDFQDTGAGSKVSATGLSPTLTLKGKDFVDVGFEEARNALRVTVRESGINVHLNFRDEATGKTGVADITGKISNITLFMIFNAVRVNDTYRPTISFNEVHINKNDAELKYDYSCGDCNEEVHSRITHALKVRLFEHIQSEAVGIVNTRISTVVNLQLQTMYPDTFPLTSEISISVGTTGVIEVKKDFVAVPIDSTIFLNKMGYNRPIEAPVIDIRNPQNPGDMLLFTSDYVFKCISIIMNHYPQHFEIPVYGVPVHIDVNNTYVPFELESEVGNMRLLAGGRITVPLYNVWMEFGINTKLDLDLRGGNSLAMLYMHPTLVGATFSTLRINIWGFNLDLKTTIVPYLDWIIVKLLNVMFLPQFAIPKLDALPIIAKQAQLEFFEDYVELGFSFAFDR